MLSRDRLYEIFGYYEDDRFYHVENGFHYYVCEHPRPINITSFSNETETVYRSTTALSLSRVLLEKYSSAECVGYAGQCKVCGKVYYR